MIVQKLDIVRIDDETVEKLIKHDTIIGQRRWFRLDKKLYIFTGDSQPQVKDAELVVNLTDMIVDWEAEH